MIKDVERFAETRDYANPRKKPWEVASSVSFFQVRNLRLRQMQVGFCRVVLSVNSKEVG